MVPTFEKTHSSSTASCLLCPHCGGYYLHHMTTEVFERREDAEKGTHITVKREALTMDTSVTTKDGNPSSRRSGINIILWCEDCNNELKMTMSQHKGLTYMGIAPTGKVFTKEERDALQW